jgi:hypothetical protein
MCKRDQRLAEQSQVNQVRMAIQKLDDEVLVAGLEGAAQFDGRIRGRWPAGLALRAPNLIDAGAFCTRSRSLCRRLGRSPARHTDARSASALPRP